MRDGWTDALSCGVDWIHGKSTISFSRILVREFYEVFGVKFPPHFGDLIAQPLVDVFTPSEIFTPSWFHSLPHRPTLCR